MDHPFPRDGLLEKELEDVTSMRNVEVREDGHGNVWLIINRNELDFFLEHCRKIDKFLSATDDYYEGAPDQLGKQ